MKRLFGVLAVVVLGDCASGKAVARSDVTGTTAAEYYPLKIGNTWTYDMRFLGQKQTETVTVEKESEGYFVTKSSSQEAEPVKMKADAYGVRDEKRYLLREPVEAGTTWTNVVSVETTEHYKILAARSPCEVPAGKFTDCVVVESRVRLPQGNLRNEMTFVRGIGLARVATELEANGKQVPQVSLELVAFTLGK
jgi:hypothetical protein